jgi:hypothetical protein
MTATFLYRYLGVAGGMKVLMRKRSNPDTAFVPSTKSVWEKNCPLPGIALPAALMLL